MDKIQLIKEVRKRYHKHVELWEGNPQSGLCHHVKIIENQFYSKLAKVENCDEPRRKFYESINWLRGQFVKNIESLEEVYCETYDSWYRIEDIGDDYSAFYHWHISDWKSRLEFLDKLLQQLNESELKINVVSSK